MNKPDQAITAMFRLNEVQALDQLAREQDMSRDNVLRAALRLYQMAALKRRAGYDMTFLDADGRPEPQFSKLPPA